MLQYYFWSIKYPCYFWSSMCNTLWRFKFPLCEYSFPQTSQLNHLTSSSVPREAIYIFVILSLDKYPYYYNYLCYFWSSMCNTLWRFKFPLCENSFPQTSQLNHLRSSSVKKGGNLYICNSLP